MDSEVRTLLHEISSAGAVTRDIGGRCPFMWAQSLYITGNLLQEDLIAPGELDPMNRRLSSLKKPDVVVQVVVLAEDNNIKSLLAAHNIQVQTKEEVVKHHCCSLIDYEYSHLAAEVYYLKYNVFRYLQLKSNQLGFFLTSTPF